MGSAVASCETAMNATAAREPSDGMWDEVGMLRTFLNFEEI
jgi:hypothetical protein